MKKTIRIVLALFLIWVCFVGGVYALMRQPPERFAAAMAKMPGPAFLLFPFETLWFRARGGRLKVGDAAPDFRLAALDKQSQTTLSAFRGQKPVCLIFGSYT